MRLSTSSSLFWSVSLMSNPEISLEAYWLALGKFVHRYSEIERTMHQVLRIVSDIPDRSAKVLFSGTRVSGATDIVKRFYAARKKPVPSNLARAFERLGVINKARDRLLHNGFSISGDKAIVTDETKNIAARAFKHEVTVEDLDDLEADAITLNSCLVSFWIEARRPDLLGSTLYLEHMESARQPWRYKQPKPMRPKSSIRGSVRERKSPPRSSEA
jgi:hypothetical protein